MAGLDFIIRGDNSDFLNKLKEIQNGVRSTADKIEQSGMTIEDMFSRLTKAAAAFGAGFSATEFVKQMVQVRGEFQQLEVAFTTMLGGSQEAANNLMQQLVKLAATTPFDLQGVADGARQLLAYGDDVNNITDDLTRLGNIAAGLSQPLGDLVYLYGTTMTQGRLYTQDLNQFTGRGIPMIRELAKVFGVTEEEVKNLVTEGKVGFPEVQKVIQNLTNEGGMFYNLMQEQSKTITGQISNIEDSFSTMLNDIGKSSEGVINDALSGVSYLIDNYEKIGKVLLTVISAYGAYKAALITVAALQRLQSIYGSITAFISLARSITSAKDAMALFNLVTKANPIGLILGAVAAAATAFGLFSDNISSASQMSAKFGEQASATITKVNTLASEVNGLTKETSLRGKVIDELNGILEDYGVQAIKESDSIDVVNEKRREAIELIKQEAIERDRLNNIDAGDQTYQQKLQDAQNDFLKSLQEARSGGGGIFSFVSDNSEIQDNAAAISTIIGNVVQENISKIAGKTGEEYEKGLNDIFNTIQDRMRAIGISEKTISEEWTGGGLFSQSNIVQDYIDKVQEASEEHDRYTNAVNKAADAEKAAADSTSTYSQRVAMLEKSLQKPNEGVHQLYQNIKNLMSQYSNNTIGFTIRIGGEIPQWMNSKSIPELQRLAKQFSAIGATSKNGAFVNGKYMTQQQLLQRGADYATAAEQKQTEADRKKQEQANKKTESDTKKKNDNSLKEQQRAAEQRKRTQEQLNKDLLSLQQQNQDDEIALMQEGTQKKLAEIDNDYKKRIDEIDKQEAEFKNKNKEAGATGLTGGLTSEQQKALQEARDNAAKEKEKQTKEVYLAEAQAMRDYLKQYGTFQQQKLAIAEEYAERIKNAQNEGERLSLTAERDQSLQQVEINAIKQNIDWGSVFGDFGTMFKDQLQPTIDQLRHIAQSDTFKQSSLEDQKTLYELIDKLEQSNTVWDSDIFKRVSDDIKAYQQAMVNYTKAVNDARKAEVDYVNAQKAHDAALKTGNSNMIQATQAAVDETKSAYMEASKQVKTFGTEVQQTTTDLNSSALKAKNMFDNLASGLQGLSSGSLQGIGNGIMQLDKLFSGGELTKNAGNDIAKGFQSLLGKNSEAAKTLSEALGNSGLAGEIISAILSMLDILAQGGIGGLVSNLYDTVSNSINGILKDVLSGDIVTKPLESVVNGTRNILNTLTFGGLNSLLGGNDKEVMETVNRLTESNEYLRTSIDKLSERINDSAATNEQSIEYYNNARDAELEWEENQREIIKSLASAWTNSGYGFLGLGGKGSFNSHAPGSGWEGWDAFTQTLKNNGINIKIDEVGDLWNLTPEQMSLLRDNNPKEWQKLFSGDGHKNPLDKVEEYIDRAGTLEELTNALNEKLTGYSWDSFLDQYKSLIKDMKDDISNFGDFINETISNALIEAFVNEKLQDDIKDLYEYIANAAPDGLSEDEIDEIRRQNEAIANQAAAWRESMVEAGLITESSDKTQQSASSKGFETMSQDTANELNGRFTALYEVGLRIDDSNKNIRDSIINTVTGINSLVSLTTDGNAELRNILNQQVIVNSHLEDIAKYTKPISELGVKLDKIVSKVNNL